MSIHKELTRIQKELRAPKNQYNSFGKYNYRSCEDILEGLKECMGDCSVILNDDVIMVGDRIYIKATATISLEGESISTSAMAREALIKKGMDESMITGTASSYARKYALNGLFCIDDTKDADTQNNTTTPTKAPKKVNTGAGSNTKKAKLGTNTAGYSKAFTAYRDAKSNEDRNKVKQSVISNYADANEVLNKLQEDYNKYLAAK